MTRVEETEKNLISFSLLSPFQCLLFLSLLSLLTISFVTLLGIIHVQAAKLRILTSISQSNIIADDLHRYNNTQEISIILYFLLSLQILTILFILSAKYSVYVSFVNFNSQEILLNFFFFSVTFNSVHNYVERPSGIEGETVFLAGFSKKRNKFHTIERRNRSSHPLHVPSPLEEIIPRYRCFSSRLYWFFYDFRESLQLTLNGHPTSLVGVNDWKDFLRQYKAFGETLEIFSDILSLLSFC